MDGVFDFGLPLKEALQTRGLTFPPNGLHLIAEVVARLRTSYGDRIQGIKLVGSRARGKGLARNTCRNLAEGILARGKALRMRRTTLPHGPWPSNNGQGREERAYLKSM